MLTQQKPSMLKGALKTMTHFDNQVDVFDYVKSVYADAVSCIRLKGGAVNYVYRIGLESTSVILKHYGPTLASNKEFPFSQDRYFVEKEALLKFSSISTKDFKVPKLLYFKDEDYVIIMEDAGEDSISLMTYFKKNEHHLDMDNIDTKIINFLLKLNSIDVKRLSPIFKNTLARQTVSTFYKNLQIYVEKSKSESLLHYSGSKMPAIPASPVIIFGDLWPNSLHINLKSKTIWIIDWEFARFGSAFEDVSQFIANIWLMEQKYKEYEIERVRDFRNSFIQKYLNLVGSGSQSDAVRFLVYVVLLVHLPSWDFNSPQKIIEDAAAASSTIFK
eukprot:NODE_44_length_33449_cov_1.575742.p13 type:complete len:331 gc:universal NODE_44_length_33449_cov_1.575742:23233-24225(+)